MSATIIDGKAIAARVRADVAREVEAFVAEHGRAPGLATVLVGEDPASALSRSISATTSSRGASAGSCASSRSPITSTASS